MKEIPEEQPIPFDGYCYASGRTALYQILKSIKITTFKVWLPDWLCESMIDAVKKTGLAYAFYPLGKDLRMDVGQFVESNRPISEYDVIILVNYFGLVDVDKTIRQLRQYGVESIVIEDDVQALFSFMDDVSTADYRFTSLRKTVACPDGGLVKTRSQMPEVGRENHFAALKLRGALIKGNADETTSDESYLELFEAGEREIDNDYESGMSEVSGSLLAGMDLKETARRRVRNARYVVEELQKIGIESLLPLNPRSVPLFVPILINQRDELRRELRRQAIFCPVHWPLREDMRQLPMGALMAEKELSLVIDQRYGLEDMSSMVEVIKEFVCK